MVASGYININILKDQNHEWLHMLKPSYSCFLESLVLTTEEIGIPWLKPKGCSKLFFITAAGASNVSSHLVVAISAMSETGFHTLDDSVGLAGLEPTRSLDGMRQTWVGAWVVFGL